ncbi:MAG: right-handed parallel beta-helix repeat-containing protein [Candidatus Dadabacteria bacterium]
MIGKRNRPVSKGIYFLSLFAALLLVGFHADVFSETRSIDPGETFQYQGQVKCNACAPCPECPDVADAGAASYGPAGLQSEVVCSKTVSRVGNAQAVVNSTVPGQTVCMEPGTYNFNVAFYPRPGVHIYCKPGAKLVFDGGDQEGVRFNTNVSDAILEGCEITGGWDGVKVTGDSNIVRNNYIHGNRYNGILITAASQNIIEGNRIERNGTRCFDKAWGGDSPRHCHDIYLSNPKGYCDNMSGNRVLNNYLGPSTGAGVNFNGEPCPGYYIEGTIVEGNKFVDVNIGIALWHGTRYTVIKNNSFSIQSPPASNMVDTLKVAISVWGGAAKEPIMSGNTFRLKSGYREFSRD